MLLLISPVFWIAFSGCLSVDLTEQEQAVILRMIRAEKPDLDSTNQWDGKADAIAFGESLFFSTELSEEGISCATCHDPDLGFSDGASLSTGVGTTARHSPHLYNVGFQNWFFWDGRCDSLWCQAIGPLESDIEMATSRTQIGLQIANNNVLKSQYEGIFGTLPDMSQWIEGAKPSNNSDVQAQWDAMTEDDQYNSTEVMVNIAKSIAAYEATIVSAPAPIDDFLLQFQDSPKEAMHNLSPMEEYGLRLFIGEGQCHLCHSGSNFSNGEFHNLGLGTRDYLSDIDTGRYEGISKLIESPFNSAGLWSDDPTGDRAKRLDRLIQSTEQLGQFKTPSLRNLGQTAPYMHGGQLASLAEVLHFYANPDQEAAIQGHRSELLQPLNWGHHEIHSLMAFLDMLNED